MKSSAIPIYYPIVRNTDYSEDVPVNLYAEWKAKQQAEQENMA